MPAAFELPEQSYQAYERYGIETELTYLIFDDVWDPLRQHPRLRELLDKVGFTKVNPKRMK